MKQERRVPKRRFRTFSDDWEEHSLGDVLQSQYNGQTPSRNHEEFWNGDIPWLSSGELNHWIVTDTIEKITPEGVCDANLRIVPKGTFIIAITGLEAEGTRGNCALLGLDTTVNQSCMALFPKEKLLDTNFLFQWYNRVGDAYGQTYTQGTKQQSYNAELIQRIPITIPSIEEQQKIGTYLNHLDQLIVLHERKLQKLEHLKQAYLAEMFPTKGERQPRRRFNGFSGDWKEVSIGEIADFSKGSGYSKADLVSFGHPIILYGRLYTDYRLEISSVDTFVNDTFGAIMSTGREVIVPASGETAEDISIASAVIKSGIILGGDLNIIHPKASVSPTFLALSISNGETKKALSKLAQGKTVVHVHNEDIKGLHFFLPSKSEQDRIAMFFMTINKQFEMTTEKLAKLRALKQAYLSELFV